MSSNSATAMNFTQRDARVLGRALRREGGFEGRSTVNDRLLAEVERVRGAGKASATSASASSEKARRPKAAGSRRAKRPAKRASASKERGASRSRRVAKTASATAEKGPSRLRTSKSARMPSVAGVPAILEKPLAACNAVVDWLFGLRGVAKGAIIALASVGVLFLFFYQPAASLWAAHRDHDQLIVEQQSLAEMSEELEGRIAELRSEEGIMDEARVRGYAPAGEIAADASALVGEEDDGIITVLGQTPESTEDSPLTQALDVFFGYQKRA